MALSDLLQGCSDKLNLTQSWYNKNVTRLTTKGCNSIICYIMTVSDLLEQPCNKSDQIERLRYPGSGLRIRVIYTYPYLSRLVTYIKKCKILRREKTDQRMVTFAVEVYHRLLKTLTSICALFIWVTFWSFLPLKRSTNSKQKTPVPVCRLRVDHGLPRGNG
jgi:hypothetical protein